MHFPNFDGCAVARDCAEKFKLTAFTVDFFYKHPGGIFIRLRPDRRLSTLKAVPAEWSEATMAKWWKVGAVLLGSVLLAGWWLPAAARAQFFTLFGKKASQQDPPPAFSSGPEQKEPEFCPAPGNVPPGTPEFCPAPSGPQTPFLPCNEEDRTAFCDYKYPEPEPLCFWVKGEYLNWWAQDQKLSTVLATTSASPNLTSNFGALGQSATEILFGPQSIDLRHLPGGRVTGGFCLGFLPPIEISGFWLNKNNDLFSAFSNGGRSAPVLARPVLATQTGQESVFLAGFPNEVAGSLLFKSNFNLWGTDTNMFFNICSSDVAFIDFLLGYRYAELRESWQLANSAAPVNPNIAIPFDGGAVQPGNSTTALDQFSTVNRFNGGQVGVRAGLSAWRCTLMADAKLALGSTNYNETISGNSFLITPTTPFRGPMTAPGGVLALASNSGTATTNEFTIIPEFDINLGYQIHRCVRVFAGYSIFYWSSVARPANQISNVIDSRQAPTDFNFVPGFRGTVPIESINRTDFWAQGFNFGILIGY
jgi:hypothetical protein